MEREVVFEKYDWKLERSYNPEVKITALSIKKPKNVDGISIVIDMDGFNNGKMLVDNLTVYIDSYSFKNLTLSLLLYSLLSSFPSLRLFLKS